jgi:hypothetical protein
MLPRIQQLSRHLTHRPAARHAAGTLFSSAAAHGVELDGHFAQLTGLHAQQARVAFAGKVLQKSDEGYTIATFAGGCFWGPQLLFDRVPGLCFSSSAHAFPS